MNRSRQEEEDEGPGIRGQGSGTRDQRSGICRTLTPEPRPLIMCLHQFIRPGESVGIGNGSGDCRICAYDPEHNKLCASYRPLTISTLTIEER